MALNRGDETSYTRCKRCLIQYSLSTNKLNRTIVLCCQENTMSTSLRIHLVVAVFLLTFSITGMATALSLAPAWKEIPLAEGSFFDVMFSADGSTVYAGGNQMFFRSWDGTNRWGGRAGHVATMSSDGNYVVSAAGKSGSGA